MKNSKKAVVLFSGGLDSTTCLYWALKEGYAVTALIFDYGQRHRKEVEKAVVIAGKKGCPYHVTRIKLGWSAGALLNRREALPSRALSKIKRDKTPSTYVPGRNTMFLSYALSLCESIGAENIIIGANQIDYSGYPDCRKRFLSAFERAVTIGSGKKLKVLAPLINKTKREIVLLAVKLGVPTGLTWSCYKGGKRPCGRCDSCRLRKKGFIEAGVKD